MSHTDSAGKDIGNGGFQAFRVPCFARYWFGSAFAILGQQMVAVAIGWELYELTGSATVLGLVGFAQVLPVLLLALWSGSLADTFDRRVIVLIAQALMIVSTSTLGAISAGFVNLPDHSLFRSLNLGVESLIGLLGETGTRVEDPRVSAYLILLSCMGLAKVLNNPSRVAILPRLVPGDVLTNAITWNSSAMHLAATFGPALGALIVSLAGDSKARYAAVYWTDACCALTMFCCFLSLPRGIGQPLRKKADAGQSESNHCLDGLRHVLNDKVILAAISLDMFAVFFGGCTALLPMFARDILGVGVIGYSWLRAAPPIGAFAMGLFLAYRPPRNGIGRMLILSVIAFGAATLGFGLSRNYALSLLMLGLLGAFDNVSVVIRHNLVQIRTPDALRGRVAAVNGLFIGSSNELGALESGLTAALWGPVGSVLVGGTATILVVLTIARLWPDLPRLATLDQAIEAG
ncbi:MFS transporter [bacterium]|nr:MFS transporter [bacterium]